MATKKKAKLKDFRIEGSCRFECYVSAKNETEARKMFEAGDYKDYDKSITDEEIDYCEEE